MCSCILDLVIQHVKCRRNVVLSHVACMVLPYFSTLSHAWCSFLRNSTEYKLCVRTFSTTFVWNISHSRAIQLDIIANVHTSCQTLIKLEFSGQIFEKSSNIKFHKNPSSGGTIVPCRWMDRHDDANSCFLQFFECI